MSVKPHRTASIQLNEIVLSTTEIVWTTGDGANVTPKAETNTFKTGTACAELAIGAGFPTAAALPKPIGFQTAALGAINLNTAWNDAAYNYIKLWIKSDIATWAAGGMTVGLDDAANFVTAVGASHRDWALPALPAANTWYRAAVACTRTLTDGTELASMDGVGLTATVDPGVCQVWVDDIRLCNYQFGGTDKITVAPLATVGNTDMDTADSRIELWYFPFRTRLITIYECPKDVEFLGYLGSNAATWTSSDRTQGTVKLLDGQTAVDLNREWTAVAVKLGADLGAGEILSMEVSD
jgi:hypothetical protein